MNSVLYFLERRLIKWLEPRYRYDVALVFWLTCKDARERGK